MADDKTRAPDAEGQPIKENTAPAAGDPGDRIAFDDIADKLTFEGEPVFKNVVTDPDTGDLLEYELTPEMQERLEAKYKEIAKAGSTLLKANADSLKKMQEAANKALEPLLKASAASNKMLQAINKSMEPYREMTAAIKNVTNTLLSDETRQRIKELSEIMQPLQDLLKEIDALEPYLKAELEQPEYAEDIEALKQAAGQGFTITEPLEIVLHTLTPGEMLELLQDKDSYLSKAFEAAREAKAADAATQIEAYKADKLDLPTDKLNLFAWDLRETKGQIKFDLSRAGSDDDATALFSLSFDDDPNIKLTKEIDHYDKRVMSACGTAFASGYPIISATGIYYAMGNTGKPSQKHIDKINDTLTKLDMAKVFVDNTIEAGTYNYPKFRKEDRLLHFKRVSRIVNGKTTDAVIQILEEPVLMTFARQRKQISAIPIKVLQTPARRSNNYYQIEDYLLWRIAQQKNKVGKLREQQQKKYTQNRQRDLKEAAELTILLATFYERTGNAKKDATGKKRARNTAEECLKHYKSEAGGCWITDYKMKSDRILITLPIK